MRASACALWVHRTCPAGQKQPAMSQCAMTYATMKISVKHGKIPPYRKCERKTVRIIPCRDPLFLHSSVPSPRNMLVPQLERVKGQNPTRSRAFCGAATTCPSPASSNTTRLLSDQRAPLEYLPYRRALRPSSHFSPPSTPHLPKPPREILPFCSGPVSLAPSPGSFPVLQLEMTFSATKACLLRQQGWT